MKLVLPHGGYGLGNDLIPWAKGFILAQELNARLLHPAWGNNPRRYYEYFRTFRYDYQFYRMLVRTLPRYRFTEEDYRSIGINDFSESCRVFVREKGLLEKKHCLVEITGFWGAFGGLENARDFILKNLLSTAHTQGNLYSVSKTIKPGKVVVGLHVRLGDFRPAGTFDYSGIEQASIPLDWYLNLSAKVESVVGSENVQFLVCSDGRPEQLGELAERDNVIFTSQLPFSDISDLLLMRGADLLICSISSFSMWAAFLSRAPYIWYRPNLISADGGLGNKFIRSLGVGNPTGLISGDGAGRGVALGMDEPLPAHLVEQLRILSKNKKAASDLVRGGTVP